MLEPLGSAAQADPTLTCRHGGGWRESQTRGQHAGAPIALRGEGDAACLTGSCGQREKGHLLAEGARAQ
jgi:hypothetical protein